MEAEKINYLYPGHYNNYNEETLVKLKDMVSLSRSVLSGDINGFPNPDDTFGLRLAVDGDGYRIIYNENAVKWCENEWVGDHVKNRQGKSMDFKNRMIKFSKTFLSTLTM